LSEALNGELQSNVNSKFHSTERSKKAVSALLWMSDLEMSEIESILTQFGGRYNGASGPVRSVSSRISDVLPLIIDITKLKIPDSKADAVGKKLLIRLDTGTTADTVELASALGTNLSRGDYRALKSNRVMNFEALKGIKDEELFTMLNNNSDKLTLVREAQKQFLESQTDKKDVPEVPLHES